MKKIVTQKPKVETKISEQQATSSIKSKQIQSVKPGTSSLQEPKNTKPVAVSPAQKQSNLDQNLSEESINQEKKAIVAKSNPPASKIAVSSGANKISTQQKTNIKASDKKDQKSVKKGSTTKKIKINVFAMINKNIIQIIQSFLKPQEACKLAITSKSMYELSNQGIQNTLSSLFEQKQQLQQTHNLKDEQLQAIIYLKHFDAFKIRQRGYFSCHDFKNPDLKELIYTLWMMVAEKDSEGLKYLDRNFGDESFHFRTDHKLQNATADKIQIVDQCLSRFTDEYVETGKLKDKYSRIDVIQLQKYLKGIKLFIQLDLNEESVKFLEKIYFDHFLKLDRNIYFYQKTSKQAKERLEIYNCDFSKVHHLCKTKDVPRPFFY